MTWSNLLLALCWLFPFFVRRQADLLFHKFSHEIERLNPLLWEKLGEPGPDHKTAAHQKRLRDLIWKREYMTFENTKLRLIGKQARQMQVLTVLSWLPIYCYLVSRFLNPWRMAHL